MAQANDPRHRDAGVAPSPAQVDEQKRRFFDSVPHIVVTTGVGSAFGAMVALTIANLPSHYDRTAPWSQLKMSGQDFNGLCSAVAITAIAVVFIEPLIEYIRWGVRGIDHRRLISDPKNPSRLNWFSKTALGIAFLLLIMSQEAIRPYVDMQQLVVDPAHKAIAFEVLGAAALISGTTLAWAYSAPFRLATIVGCLASLSLATVFVLVYTPFKDRFSPDPHIIHVMTPSATEKPPSSDSVEKKTPAIDSTISSRTQPILADKAATDSTKTGHGADQVPTATTENTDTDEKTGTSGKTYSLGMLRESLAFVFYATIAWTAVGLIGGLIIDYVRILKPSTILVIGLVFVTSACDAVFQLWFWKQKFAPIEVILWAGLGAGWALGILIVAPSVDAIFSRRDKDVPALLVSAVSRRWQKRNHRDGKA